MRKAIILSLIFHIVLGVVTMRIVRIRHVRFVPREVFAVKLVSMEQAVKPPVQEVAPPPEEKPPVPAPKIEEPPKEEELVTPVKKKKATKKEEPKKVQPPQVEKQEIVESSEVDTTTTAEVVTGDMALDVEDFPFAYYLATIKRKIAANWRVPGTTGGSLHCRVYFRIGKSGTIDSPSVETSSGNFLFDQAAQRAVIQASPLPPLPGGFGDDFLGVHFSFAYEEK
jgi:TonB family protein